MKISRLFSGALVAVAMMTSINVDAGSIGRSSPSISRSYSAPSPSRSYSAPSASPSSFGGIGGSGSMGVRKSEVTAPVANRVAAARAPSYTPTPSYNQSPPTPSYSAPVSPSPSVGSSFMSSFGGSFAGSMLGNAISGHSAPHYSGGVPNVQAQQNYGGGAYGVAPLVAAPSYGIGSLIGDILLFVILAAVVVGAAFLFYKGYKMIRAYYNKERGIATTQPFSPTTKFWEIQRAFAAAETLTLHGLIGPDMIDEATTDLEPSELKLSNVSHEVVLNNPREFSVHYTFSDIGLRGVETVDQVWHYELFDGTWKLNGIETV